MLQDTLKIFYEQGDIIEIRTIGKVTSTGYFDDVEKAAREAAKFDGKSNVYFMLNKIDPACYHRENKDKIIDKSSSTSDNDIIKRNWILLDFDPKRAAKTSATDEEKSLAEEIMKKIGKYLKNKGFKSPVIADSGNGWHLLYRIDMPNDNESKKLIETFLKTCDMLFSTETVDVDISVFNASRITKLYGTMSKKGADTKERPHRRSEIAYIPKVIEVNPKEKIKEISNMMPTTTRNTNNNYNAEFSIDDFISKHHIRVAKASSFSGGQKYILEECPFDKAHGKDSAIVQLPSGALAFHCFHNGCAYNTWKEFRELYEPLSEREAHKQHYETKREYKPKKEVNLTPQISQIIDDETLKILKRAKSLSSIRPFDRKNIEIFSFGIDTLDSQVEVLLGKLAVVTGVNGSGKSTFLGQVMLEALEQNHNVFTYSGELKPDEFQYWVDLQAAGTDNLIEKTSKKGKKYYEIKADARHEIHKWYNDKFFLYNNEESMKYEDILTTIEAYRVHKGCRVIFLDNFLTLDISSLSDKDLEAQTKFIWSLAQYVKKNNVLVFLVIHPRKIFDGICQKQDVLGTGNFSNAIDYMFIVHRINDAFRSHMEKRKLSKTSKEIAEKANNMIEIGKDRWTGKEGLNVPLKFCEDNKRLVDYQYPWTANKEYSWNKRVQKKEVIKDEECPF